MVSFVFSYFLFLRKRRVYEKLMLSIVIIRHINTQRLLFVLHCCCRLVLALLLFCFSVGSVSVLLFVSVLLYFSFSTTVL